MSIRTELQKNGHLKMFSIYKIWGQGQVTSDDWSGWLSCTFKDECVDFSFQQCQKEV